MARPLRIEYPGAWYHVTCRGNGGAAIFKDDRDKQRFNEALIESLKHYNVELHCFVLMVNHFHFIVRTALANLSRFMQRFNTAYSTYFNIKHDRHGHLYQGRFKSILIEADEYLLELSRYIHLNPVRTKKYQNVPLENKIEDLFKYRWSSFPGYMNKKKQKPHIHYDTVLNYLGGNHAAGLKNYRNFVIAGLANKIENPLHNVHSGLVLGSEDFLQWVEDSFLYPVKPKNPDIEDYSDLITAISAKDIADIVSKEYGITSDCLLQKGCRFGEARHVLFELCYSLNIRGKSLRELGRELGGVSGAHIARVHSMMNTRMKKDSNLKGRVDRLIQLLLA